MDSSSRLDLVLAWGKDFASAVLVLSRFLFLIALDAFLAPDSLRCVSARETDAWLCALKYVLRNTRELGTVGRPKGDPARGNVLDAQLMERISELEVSEWSEAVCLMRYYVFVDREAVSVSFRFCG